MQTDDRTSRPVKVLLFSILREKTGVSEMSVDIEQAEPVAAFLERLVSQLPPLSDFESTVRLAVNGSYAEPRDLVEPGDEVAVITPVSGG